METPTHVPPQMDRRFLIGGLAGAAGFAALAALARGGPVNPPPGPVASTGKTLSSVEPRIDIIATVGTGAVTTSASYEFIINAPGSYYLSANYIVTKPNGILINAPDVRLDLHGFELSRATASGDAIAIATGCDNAVVCDGSIRNFANGVNGLVAFPFARGCAFSGLAIKSCGSAALKAGASAAVENCSIASCGASINVQDSCRVSNCSVYSCSSTYVVSVGVNSIVSDCTLDNCTGIGIYTLAWCIIRDCSITRCTGDRGIYGGGLGVILNCSTCNNTVTWGIEAGTQSVVENCTATQNTGGAAASGGILAGSGCSINQCAANSNQSSATFSATTGQGFSTDVGCTVVHCTANYNRGNGISSVGSLVRDCAVFENDGYGISASQSNIIDCLVYLSALSGIRADSTGVVRGCTSAQNLQHGITVEVGGGIDILQNICELNGNNSTAQGAGIRANSGLCRIQDNHCNRNWINVLVPSGIIGMVITRNFAGGPGSGSNFVIAANNKVAPIVSAPASAAINGNTGGAGLGSTDPFANISY